MLDYIKKRIQAMQPVDTGYDEHLENDAIMECAHLIQELDDLSIEGSELNQMRDIDALSISLEDDVELDSVEVSISNGQILDSPADVLVHSEHYEYMKSEDDFIKEAAGIIHREYMEDDSSYNARVMECANKKYDAYKQHIIQEGLFSSNKVSVMDPSVQWYRNVDFGPSDPNNPNSTPYVTRLEIAYFPADRSRSKILVKQRDSIAVIIDAHPEACKGVGSFYSEYLQKHGYEIPKGRNLWEIVVPKRILVPVEPVDRFVIVIEAENVISKNKEDDVIYCGFSLPIKASRGITGINDFKTGMNEISKASVTRDENPRITLNANLINKNAAIREAYREKTPIGRVVQEAIDFGDDSTPPGGDGDNGGDAISNTEPAATDIPAATDDAVDGSTQEPTATTTSNDVSSQIADKVEEKTEEQNAAINGDVGDSTTDANDTGEGLDTPVTDIPDDLTDNPDMDTSNLDNGGDSGSIDDQLNSLNDMGNASELDDTNTALGTDISDMSPDELKNAVVDKVNKMPISQIQAFLSGDDTSDTLGDTTGSDPVTEAFVLTKKNINAELDVCLRKCLGDLNDTSKSLDEILTAFKKDGKKLNKALSKATKMTDVYQDSERNQFIKLNKCTADLIVSFNSSKMDVKVTKRLIKAFASNSMSVGKIIDKHKNDKPDTGAKRVVE